MTDRQWWQDAENLAQLAHYLYDRGQLIDGTDFAYFIRKPWRWQNEWSQLQLDADRRYGEWLDHMREVAHENTED